MKKHVIFTTSSVLAIAGMILTVNAAGISKYLGKMSENQQMDGNVIFLSDSKTDVSNGVDSDIPDLIIEPQIAPVSYQDIDNYLSKVMTDDEIQMIYDFIDNNYNTASISTRELTEKEWKRRLILTDNYEYDGIRPEEALEILNPENEFYYDGKTDTYHYPERELTDEEILQWIDWSYRINYALNLRIPDEYRGPEPTVKDISEEEANAKAIDAIKKVYDTEVSHLNMSALFLSDSFGVPKPESSWFISYEPLKMRTLQANDEQYWSYSVVVDSLTGEVNQIGRIEFPLNEEEIKESDKEKIYNDDNLSKVAKETVLKISSNKEVKEVFIDKEYDSRYASMDEDFKKETTVRAMASGVVDVVVLMEDATSYMVSIAYPSLEVKNIILNNN